MRWATGRRRPAPQREREIEARLVERLVDEIETDDCPQFADNACPQIGDKAKAAESRTP